MKITAVVTCAGKGVRANFKSNKLLQLFNGKTVLESAVYPFDDNAEITEIILTARSEDLNIISKIAENFRTPTKIVLGGKTRSASVYNALKETTGDIVIIHDGARPFVYNEIIEACINSVKKYGTGITCVPCTDTVGETDENGTLLSTDRKNKLSVQTPQGFYTDKILKAYEMVNPDECFTDDAGVYTKYIGKCKVVSGDIKNKKLTYPEDFKEDKNYFAGTGFDLHKLAEGRKLILGGIEIPYEKGLLGHSDADVLTHAVMDALLSSAALRDIGCQFSDADPRYKDISSIILLKRVIKMLEEKGYKIKNVTAVIMAEKPRLSSFIPKISEFLADVMQIPDENVGLTCTTTEGIGTVGREEGIAAQAYCLTYKI